MPIRPVRPTPPAPRGLRATALSTTACAVLAVGLLGSAATAAHASESAPATPAPAAAVAVAPAAEHPAITGAIAGVFDVPTGQPVVEGTRVSWTAHIVNNGDAALHGVHLNDPETGIPGVDAPGVDLPVGGTVDLTTETTVTAHDRQLGAVIIYRDVTGLSPEGTRVFQALNGGITIPGEHPHVVGDITGAFEDPAVTLGTTVKWSVPVTNDGDVPLHDVRLGDAGPGVDLAVHQKVELSVEKKVTQEDLDRGSVAIASEVTGLSPQGFRTVHGVKGALAITVRAAVPLEPSTTVEPAAPLEPSTTVEPAAPLEPATTVEPAAPLQSSTTVVPTAPVHPAGAVSPAAPVRSAGHQLAQTGADSVAALPAAGALLLAGAALALGAHQRRRPRRAE
ncbi:LPXTG cell wall anchor domain-containing protein [Rathayibacter sp. VKM Ac-2760]|uniref:DUF7507 domain-containing protein n=1 Tax=Rathayibacter sp. VKM Ac-2760 TaxID=2609253 RepID=UPI001315C35A|nr:LPXTG cell wall anchor domain-containing protein [Rathayibacter sp. VKM Ac-2760]QHC60038.1 LPXTG cell wall anchor domain-containing protein [Rathayibacter sp. VKM Ac-2760]